MEKQRGLYQSSWKSATYNRARRYIVLTLSHVFFNLSILSVPGTAKESRWRNLFRSVRDNPDWLFGFCYKFLFVKVPSEPVELPYVAAE